MPLFVKIERGVVEKAVFDRHVPAHAAYVRKLNAAGCAARSGYWAELRGERAAPAPGATGGGMMVFEAPSIEEARRLVERDPLVREGCVEYELHEWRVVEG